MGNLTFVDLDELVKAAKEWRKAASLPVATIEQAREAEERVDDASNALIAAVDSLGVDRAHDRADRWRRYAVTTFIGLVVIWAGFMAYVMATPVKASVLIGRTMTIHCPSEDGGRPGCVWDTWTDGNGRGDPDGPRWLVWP